MNTVFGGRRMTLTAMVVAATLAGCGGGGSGKSVSSPTTVAGNPPASSSTPGGEFCDLIKTYSDRLASLSRSSTRPPQIRQLAQDAGAAISAGVASAPADIKADTTIVAGAAESYLAALQAAGYDLAKVPPDASAVFQAPDVAPAVGRFTSYAKDVCGVRS